MSAAARSTKYMQLMDYLDSVDNHNEDITVCVTQRSLISNNTNKQSELNSTIRERLIDLEIATEDREKQIALLNKLRQQERAEHAK